MVLAALQQTDKHYGEQTVLDSVTLEIRAGSRIALIGRNGAGKSTILRLLMNQEQPDGGTVHRRDDITIAMLEQDPLLDADASVLEVSERAFKDLDVLEERLSALEHAGLDQPEVYERWEQLHEVFERRGGYERRARRDAVLHSLGFRGREHERAAHLSGGEKTRLGLAQLLMNQPDVLLLDEPTNHLDVDMIEWLEGYLTRYPGGMVIVSHDRAFLDTACSSTAEISRGKLRTFDATPSAYWDYRFEQLRIEEATRANQQREHDRIEASATQMKKWAGQNAKLHRRAKSMFKRLERYEEGMLGEAERKERKARFRFDCAESGEIVLHAEHLTKRFGGRTLFQDVRFTLRKGERVALVGPNGAGKSSFVKMVLGDLPSDDHRAALHFGSRVRVGYYDQELRGVDPELTLIDEMIRLVGDVEAHNLLGRFLFPYDAQYKRIADLSGGERARLSLLKLTLGEYNFLVLDEPTNHLDLEMIEALETALDMFEGTLLIVSHDRRFIQETTDLIWEIRDGAFTPYEGDWNYYLLKRKERREQAQAGRAQAGKEAREDSQPSGRARGAEAKKIPSRWQLERTLKTLEERIDSLEQELNGIAAKLASPDRLDPEEIWKLGEEHTRVEGTLLEVMSAWEEATELLSSKAG
jgi:ATP-binding cassette subfamily F protein 3